MAIRAPRARLLTEIPFRFLKVGAAGRKAVDTNIALIPFIDFLMVVVVFLLMSFSASGETMATAELPEALHGTELESAPIVHIDGRVVTLDGRRMVGTAELLEDADGIRIDPLVRDLEVLRDNWPILHPNEEFEGRVIVQASRDVDFRALRKVLASLGQAGFGGVELAVREAG